MIRTGSRGLPERESKKANTPSLRNRNPVSRYRSVPTARARVPAGSGGAGKRERSAAWGGRKRGMATSTMRKKMPITVKMISMPPEVMSQRAMRSRRLAFWMALGFMPLR